MARVSKPNKDGYSFQEKSRNHEFPARDRGSLFWYNDSAFLPEEAYATVSTRS